MKTCRQNNIVPMGALYAAVSANNKVAEIVSPSVNQYGLIIRTCCVSGAVTPPVGVQLFADIAPPSVYGDATKRLIFIGVAPPSDHMSFQLYVPPGNGLWMATNGNGSVNITYDLLSDSRC